MTPLQERHHALDLVRGLAALGIAVVHWFTFFDTGADLQSLSTFGVYVFFMLSALTMMLVYRQTFSTSIRLIDAQQFYWNRVTRITPLLVAVAIISFVLQALAADPSVHFRHIVKLAIKAFLTGSGLFSLHLPGYLSNAMGAWSLGIEIFFYLLFPLICMLANASTFRSLLGAVAVMVLGQQMVIALLQQYWGQSIWWAFYTTPLTFAPYFAIGLLIFKTTDYDRKRINLLWTCMALVAIAAFSPVTRAPVLASHANYLALMATAFLALYFAYHTKLPALLVRTASFLGNVSYSLYLTHPFSARIAKSIYKYDSFTLGSLIYLLIAVTIAYLSWTLFESPARKFLRRLYAGDGSSFRMAKAL